MVLTEGQQRALELAESGANLFITGAAGTGKSVVLGRIIERLVGQRPVERRVNARASARAH